MCLSEALENFNEEDLHQVEGWGGWGSGVQLCFWFLPPSFQGFDLLVLLPSTGCTCATLSRPPVTVCGFSPPATKSPCVFHSCRRSPRLFKFQSEINLPPFSLSLVESPHLRLHQPRPLCSVFQIWAEDVVSWNCLV